LGRGNALRPLDLIPFSFPDPVFLFHVSAFPFSVFETRSLPALTRSYPCRFTFYVAHPVRSIQLFTKQDCSGIVIYGDSQ
jgi:hypothetical protein